MASDRMRAISFRPVIRLPSGPAYENPLPARFRAMPGVVSLT